MFEINIKLDDFKISIKQKKLNYRFIAGMIIGSKLIMGNNKFCEIEIERKNKFDCDSIIKDYKVYSNIKEEDLLDFIPFNKYYGIWIKCDINSDLYNMYLVEKEMSLLKGFIFFLRIFSYDYNQFVKYLLKYKDNEFLFFNILN